MQSKELAQQKYVIENIGNLHIGILYSIWYNYNYKRWKKREH